MKANPLTAEEAALNGGHNWMFIVTADDLTDTVDSEAQAIHLFTFKAGDVCNHMSAVLKVPFEDTTDATTDSTLMIVGDDDDDNAWLTSTQVNRNGTEVYYQDSWATATSPLHAVYTGTKYIILTVTPKSSTKCSELNKGEIHFYATITRLADLSAAWSSQPIVTK